MQIFSNIQQLHAGRSVILAFYFFLKGQKTIKINNIGANKVKEDCFKNRYRPKRLKIIM